MRNFERGKYIGKDKFGDIIVLSNEKFGILRSLEDKLKGEIINLLG